MSFLDRLVERLRAEAPAPMPVLEPRLPSRFEPPSPAAGRRLVEIDVAPGVSRRSARPPLPPRAPAPTRLPAHDRDAPAAPPDPRLREVQSALVTARTTIGAPLAASTPAASDAPPIASEGAAISSVARLVPRAVVPAAVLTPAPPAIPSAPRDARPRPIASATTAVARDANEPRDTPTIHVSIGRVEVRAVTTAVPPPARPRTPVSRQSLEDYLRRRGRGAS